MPFRFFVVRQIDQRLGNTVFQDALEPYIKVERFKRAKRNPTRFSRASRNEIFVNQGKEFPLQVATSRKTRNSRKPVKP
jgi:hypothetical protein